MLTTKSLFLTYFIDANDTLWYDTEAHTAKEICNHFDFKWSKRKNDDLDVFLNTLLIDGALEVSSDYYWFSKNNPMIRNTVEKGVYYFKYVGEKDNDSLPITKLRCDPELEYIIYSTLMITEEEQEQMKKDITKTKRDMFMKRFNNKK